MASIRNRTINKPAFQVEVRAKGFPSHFITMPSLEAAKSAAKGAEAEIRKERRALSDPRSTLPASGDFADERLLETLAAFDKRMGNKSWHSSNMTGLLAVVGDPTIGQLKPSWIKRLIERARRAETQRGIGYGWSTIEKQLSIVSGAIKWRAEELDINPPPFVVKKSFFKEAAKFEGLGEEDLNNERDRRFEPGEEDALARELSELPGAIGEQFALFLRFALATGARLQEMVWAEWSEIGASGQEWHIPHKHSKTKSRTMMLTDEAMDALRLLRLLRDPRSARVFPALGLPQRGPRAEPPSGAAFAAWEADVLEDAPKRVSNAFARACKKAGLADYRLHDLRHDGISRFVLTQPDIPIKAVMTMVGHSSLEMLNRYAKLRSNELLPLMRRRSAGA